MTVNHYKFTRSTHFVRSGQAGLERDSESGLDHTWFRQYSSGYGRWLTPDPLGGDVSSPQSLNRYTYVLNDPTNLIDPFGLHWECVTITIGDHSSTSCTWVSDDPVLNCPPGWHFVVGSLGTGCIPGEILGEFVKETKAQAKDKDEPHLSRSARIILGQAGRLAAPVTNPILVGALEGLPALALGGPEAVAGLEAASVALEARLPGVTEFTLDVLQTTAGPTPVGPPTPGGVVGTIINALRRLLGGP